MKKHNEDKNIYFDPDTSFFDLKIVRTTALSFVIIFLITCGVIIYKSNLWWEWNFTYTGFNNLLNYFKVPLGFLALIIPVGAVFAANHRSEQTKKQIALTHNQIALAHNQNLFTNYYKHIEEFEKYCEKSLTRSFNSKSLNRFIGNNKDLDLRQMHKILYTDLMKSGDTNTNIELLEEIDSIGINMFNPLTHEKEASVGDIRTSVLTAMLKLNGVLQTKNLSFDGIFTEGIGKHADKIREYENKQTQLQTNIKSQSFRDGVNCYYIADFISRIEFALSTIEACAKFDTSYSGSVTLKALEASKRAILIDENEEAVWNASEKLHSIGVYSEDKAPNRRPTYDSETYVPREMAIKYTLERSELFKKYILSQEEQR